MKLPKVFDFRTRQEYTDDQSQRAEQERNQRRAERRQRGNAVRGLVGTPESMQRHPPFVHPGGTGLPEIVIGLENYTSSSGSYRSLNTDSLPEETSSNPRPQSSLIGAAALNSDEEYELPFIVDGMNNYSPDASPLPPIVDGLDMLLPPVVHGADNSTEMPSFMRKTTNDERSTPSHSPIRRGKRKVKARPSPSPPPAAPSPIVYNFARSAKESIVNEKTNRGLLDRFHYRFLRKNRTLCTPAFKHFKRREDIKKQDFLMDLESNYGTDAVLEAMNTLPPVTFYSHKGRKALLITARKMFYTKLYQNYEPEFELVNKLQCRLDSTKAIINIINNAVITEISLDKVKVQEKNKKLWNGIQQSRNEITDFIKNNQFFEPSSLGFFRSGLQLNTVTKCTSLQQHLIDTLVTKTLDEQAYVNLQNQVLPLGIADQVYMKIRKQLEASQDFSVDSEENKAHLRRLLLALDAQKLRHDAVIETRKKEAKLWAHIIAQTILEWSKLNYKNNRIEAAKLFDFVLSLHFNEAEDHLDFAFNDNASEVQLEQLLEKINQAVDSVADPSFSKVFNDVAKTKASSLVRTGFKNGRAYLSDNTYSDNQFLIVVERAKKHIAFVNKKANLIKDMHNALVPANQMIADASSHISLVKNPKAFCSNAVKRMFKANKAADFIIKASPYMQKIASAKDEVELTKIGREIRSQSSLKQIHYLFQPTRSIFF